MINTNVQSRLVPLRTSPVKASFRKNNRNNFRKQTPTQPKSNISYSPSPRKQNSRLLYFTPNQEGIITNQLNSTEINAPDNEFLSKFLYYEALLLQNNDKESSTHPERLENILDCLNNLSYFMKKDDKAMALFKICFNEVKRACTAEYFTNDDSFTRWKRVPAFMALKNIERENNEYAQHMEDRKLRLDSTIIKNRNLEKKYKDSIQMERHMKIKLEVAARAVLNEERRCKEMKDQIIRLENTINELAGALKDARQIIVENGLVPIIPSQKKIRKQTKNNNKSNNNKSNNNKKNKNSVQLETPPKHIAHLLFSDAFQRSLNNLNQYLDESTIFER